MNPGWRGNYLRYKSYFLNVIGRYRERADVKAYVEILLSLATVSIFAVFALRPTLLTIAGLIKEIESKRQTIETMQAKIDNLSSAQTLYDRERSRINILLTSIPDKPNPEIYARQIEGLSEKHGLAVFEIIAGEAVIIGKDIQLTSKETKDSKPLPEGSTELSVSATYITSLDRYSDFSNLISDFEKSRRPAKIDIIRIKTTTSEENIKILELTIEAGLPYFRTGDN
jgi:hypothetical protein